MLGETSGIYVAGEEPIKWLGGWKPIIGLGITSQLHERGDEHVK
jgi:hypothetical protein